MDIGGKQLDPLTRLLDASSLRGRVIQGNLANLNTPGFKRRLVRFEDQLVATMSRDPQRAEALQPEVTTDELTAGNPDGNNVNMELEMNAMRENRLTYETYASILEGNLNLIDAAIREGH